MVKLVDEYIQGPKNIDKFCPIPWRHIVVDTNGSIRPCCRYAQPGRRPIGYTAQTEHKMPWLHDGPLDQIWNGPELRKLRRAFINGEQPNECDQCWSEEKSGIVSYRQSAMKEFVGDVDFTTDTSPQPITFDLKLSNVCNLKCRMCSPQASSSILKEMRRLGTIDVNDDQGEYWLSNKIYDTRNESVFEAWIANTRRIELTGGEPLVSAENKKIIQRVSESPFANRITLQMNTNVTNYSDTVVNQLKNFEKVIIIGSIDDVGPRIEYARSGAVWKDLDQNIRKYISQPHIHFMIKCTVNNYNIWYLEDLIKYTDDAGIRLEFDFVYEPLRLSIKHLHPDIKTKIKNKYRSSNYLSDKLQNVLNFLDASDVDMTDDFIEFTNKIDKNRSEKFASVFKEWNEALDVDDSEFTEQIKKRFVDKLKRYP